LSYAPVMGSETLGKGWCAVKFCLKKKWLNFPHESVPKPARLSCVVPPSIDGREDVQGIGQLKMFGGQTPRRWGWGTPLKKRATLRTPL